MVRVCVVDNPHSFRGPYPLDRVAPILASAGWETRVRNRAPGQSTRRLVDAALQEGCELIVAAGGDGTLRDVAHALAGRGVPLGVLPGGTVNLWAQELGIPARPEAAARALIDSDVRLADVGRVHLPDGHFARFLLIAGLGLDGLALALTDARLKRVTGTLAIALGTLRAAHVFSPLRVAVEVDGRPFWEGAAWQVIVANARRYAGVFQVRRDALIDDGMLDVTIVPAAGWQDAARLAGSLALYRSPDPRVAPHRRGATIAVTADRPVPLELDGSPAGRAQVASAGAGTHVLRVEPRSLPVLVPRGYAGDLFGAGVLERGAPTG